MARLQAGQLDASGAYKTQPEAMEIPFLALPPENQSRRRGAGESLPRGHGAPERQNPASCAAGLLRGGAPRCAAS